MDPTQYSKWTNVLVEDNIARNIGGKSFQVGIYDAVNVQFNRNEIDQACAESLGDCAALTILDTRTPDPLDPVVFFQTIARSATPPRVDLTKDRSVLLIHNSIRCQDKHERFEQQNE